MSEVSYAFYTGEYLGNAIPEEDFPRLAARALEQIEALAPGGTEGLDEKGQRAVRKAACALAELLGEEERLRAAAFPGEDRPLSETVGSWSRSYSPAGLSQEQTAYLKRRRRELLELYLGRLPGFAGLFGVRSFRWREGGR